MSRCVVIDLQRILTFCVTHSWRSIEYFKRQLELFLDRFECSDIWDKCKIICGAIDNWLTSIFRKDNVEQEILWSIYKYKKRTFKL